jgi:hypothetical protein
MPLSRCLNELTRAFEGRTMVRRERTALAHAAQRHTSTLGRGGGTLRKSAIARVLIGITLLRLHSNLRAGLSQQLRPATVEEYP